MRDPIMRAFSEWSMFALGWFWEKNTNFEHKVSQQMRTFRECNTTLFHDVEVARNSLRNSARNSARNSSDRRLPPRAEAQDDPAGRA